MTDRSRLPSPLARELRADGGTSSERRDPGAGADDSPPREPGETVLAVEGLDSGYGDVQVLYDLSLELRRGEIACLIGPNGAGKSTVLKAVFGLLDVWSGTIRLNDREISGMAPEDIVREGVGYVPQTENVFGSLTVAENLRMGGVSRTGGVDDRIAELYDRFPLLDGKRNEKARTLSGGQRQVLAFARALMTDPAVLLIDEPSAGLAPNTAEDVFDRVQQVNELGTSILMVEQNARAGLNISDRGYVLDQGRVRFESQADELLENPEVAELYLGG